MNRIATISKKSDVIPKLTKGENKDWKQLVYSEQTTSDNGGTIRTRQSGQMWYCPAYYLGMDV